MTRRARDADWVWERLERLLPDMGITRVGNITGLDIIGVPVWAVYRPGSRSMVVSLGKALTDSAAKVSAAMESAETFCAERIAAPLLHGNVHDLGDKYPLMALEGLPRVEDPAPRESPIYWIEGRDIGNGGISCWVPYELVHTRYMPAARPYFPSFVATTRGLAAGATWEEAVCHAVLELVEGDANANAYEMPDEEWLPRQLDLGTVDDPECREIVELCEGAGVMVLALDSTTPLGIPSFVVTVLDQKDDGWRVVPAARGMGCHPSRAIALRRALLESVQSRAAMISGAREDLTRAVYSRSQNLALRDKLRSVGPGRREWREIPTREWKNAEDDLQWVLDTLALHRLVQVVAVPVNGDFPFPVVRVVIPWLRPEVLA